MLAARTITSFAQLFRFMDGTHLLLLGAAAILALAGGLSVPFFALLFGDLMTALQEEDTALQTQQVTAVAMNFIWLGLGTCLSVGAANSMFMSLAEKHTLTLKMLFLRALLRQDVE